MSIISVWLSPNLFGLVSTLSVLLPFSNCCILNPDDLSMNRRNSIRNRRSLKHTRTPFASLLPLDKDEESGESSGLIFSSSSSVSTLSSRLSRRSFNAVFSSMFSNVSSTAGLLQASRAIRASKSTMKLDPEAILDNMFMSARAGEFLRFSQRWYNQERQ